MGRLKREQSQFFYSFCVDEVVPADHRVREIADVLDLSWVTRGARTLLLAAGPAVDRSSADDSNADRRLCIRDPLGAVALTRGSGQLGISLVLRLEHRGQGPGSFCVLACPQ